MIGRLYVSPDYRGSGIGKALLELIQLDAVYERNKTWLSVNSLKSARPFYEKSGFEFAGIIGQYVQMTKRIK